jgi:hypothetical protein
MLEEFQTHQQILFDLTANYLEPLSGAYQRLAYLHSLQETGSGRYVHQGLEMLYGAVAVDKVIAQCHEEVFERLLEMPLNAQRDDLRTYLTSLPGTLERNAMASLKHGATWAPPMAPSYLKELYNSNLNVLLELLRDETSTARPDN